MICVFDSGNKEFIRPQFAVTPFTRLLNAFVKVDCVGSSPFHTSVGMAFSASPRAASLRRVRDRDELAVCLGIACVVVFSSWQVLVREYLAEPERLEWGPFWRYDHQSIETLEGAHALVIEGVLQQEAGNLCHFAKNMSKALTRLVAARRLFACAYG